MNCDAPRPFDLAQYREMQRAILGVEGLYRSVRAIFDTLLASESRILVVGAGGGRELETLGGSPKRYRFLAVDPSKAMLDMARHYATCLGVAERTTFVEGEAGAVPPNAACDAATSLLVMHFLPDDGAKLSCLRAIRARLRPGAPFLLADVSMEDRAAFERLTPVFLAHAELAGLPAAKAAIGPSIIGGMPVIGEGRTRSLLDEAGFGETLPWFRGLWYTGWWAVAR